MTFLRSDIEAKREQIRELRNKLSGQRVWLAYSACSRVRQITQDQINRLQMEVQQAQAELAKIERKVQEA